MYSSKTLEQRNNDHTPWICRTCDNTRAPWENPREGHTIEFAPRDRYQYGKLPANPILVEIRLYQDLPGFAKYWARFIERELAGLTVGDSWGDCTDDHRRHAHRVLSLLASLPSEVKA